MTEQEAAQLRRERDQAIAALRPFAKLPVRCLNVGSPRRQWWRVTVERAQQVLSTLEAPR